MALLATLKARLPRNQFWRSLTIVAGGAALGQAVSLLASPILSRLYGPADFGLLAVYASLTSIGGVVSALAYQLAIPIPKEEDEAAHLSVLALVCVVSVGLLVAVVTALTHNRIDSWVKLAGFSSYAWLLPLGVVGLGAYEVISSWAARTKSFGAIGRTSAQRSLLQVGTQLGGGVAGLGATGLVVGQLLGQWGGIFGVSRALWRRDRARFRAVRWRELAHVAHRYRRYPLLSVPAALLNALDANAAPLLFAHFFGGLITGYFALGHRLLTIPFWLIGNSAQKVFFPAAAEAQHAGRLAEETELTYRRLLCLVLPMVALLSACAPDVFTVVLGARWREAGVYMQWISVRTCFTLVVFPLMPLLYVMERQAASTIFNGLQLVVRVGAILIGTHFGDPRLSVMLLGTSTGLMWLVFLGYLLALSGNSLRKAAQRFVLEGTIAIALAAPIVVAKVAHASPVVITIVTAALSVVSALVIFRRLPAIVGARG